MIQEQKIQGKVIRVSPLLSSLHKAVGLVVLIDVFRAATTACAILSKEPNVYFIAQDDKEVTRLVTEMAGRVFLVGKPDVGSDCLFDLPNSPTRILNEASLRGRCVVHKTSAGIRGVRLLSDTGPVLLAGFVNVSATASFLMRSKAPLVTLVPVGYQGQSSAPEDDACVRMLLALLRGEPLPAIERSFLQGSSGQYFFAGNQEEYPQNDFELCLDVDRYSWVVAAQRMADRCLLNRVE